MIPPQLPDIEQNSSFPQGETGLPGRSEASLAAVAAPGPIHAGWVRTLTNRGAAGGDGLTIEDFAATAPARLAALGAALVDGSYRPGRLRPVEVPKEKGGTRLLRIPPVTDRVAQGAVLELLGPLLDPQMHRDSYAYRPGRSVAQAVRRIAALRNEGFGWVAETDIDEFFDSIPHDRLLTRLLPVVVDPPLLDLIDEQENVRRPHAQHLLLRHRTRQSASSGGGGAGGGCRACSGKRLRGTDDNAAGGRRCPAHWPPYGPWRSPARLCRASRRDPPLSGRRRGRADRGAGFLPVVIPSGSLSDPIGARLLAPARRVPLQELPELWYRHRIRVLAATPRGFVRDSGLPGRLRGAVGQRLKLSASGEAQSGQPCPWRPASALDPFFIARKLASGLEMPKPLVPFVEEEHGVLLFACDVFGFATAWSDAVADAMVAGLRDGLLDAHGVCWRFEPLQREIEELRGFELPPPDAVATVLDFSTPLCLRRGRESILPDAGALMSSLANRASGMARWHDANLEADWSDLATRWRDLRVDRSGLKPQRWVRASARQGGRLVPMVGDTGNFLLEGLDPALALLVAAGATTAVGSHAALGLGRYLPSFIGLPGAR